TNVLNPRAEVERKDEFRETRVGRGATIGANATIVCGHDIGAYALVSAGAVVTKDVPPHALGAGVPARRIGWVSHAGDGFGPGLGCPRTGGRYRGMNQDQRIEMVEQEAMAEHGWPVSCTTAGRVRRSAQPAASSRRRSRRGDRP